MSNAAKLVIERVRALRSGVEPVILIIATPIGSPFLIGIVDPQSNLHSDESLHIIHPAYCLRTDSQLQMRGAEGMGQDLFLRPDGLGFIGWGFADDNYAHHYNQWLAETFGTGVPTDPAEEAPAVVEEDVVPPNPFVSGEPSSADVLRALLEAGVSLDRATYLVTEQYAQHIETAFANGSDVETIVNALRHLA